jgi:hypothetical protein
MPSPGHSKTTSGSPRICGRTIKSLYGQRGERNSDCGIPKRFTMGLWLASPVGHVPGVAERWKFEGPTRTSFAMALLAGEADRTEITIKSAFLRLQARWPGDNPAGAAPWGFTAIENGKVCLPGNIISKGDGKIAK